METTGTDPAPTPAPVTYPTQELRFIFRGSGGEYFRIWIVNLALTLLTLGIYGAWAKVRRLRYFYGNTEIAGSSFEYHGQPVQILKGRIIALVLILPYYLLQRSYPFWSLAFLLLFLAALPFIIVKSRRFQLRMTSWRNIRFGFDGRYGQAARLYLLVPMLIPLTLGLIIPYITYLRQRFLVAQTRFGATRLEFNARGGAYYRIYGLALLVVIGIFVLVGILSVGLMGPVKALFAAAAPGGAGVDRPLLFLVIAVAYLTVIALLMVPYAMVKAGTTNQALGLATLGPHSVHSRLASGKLAWIYVSNLVLTILTLGLFAPWASVRAVKYQLDNTSLTAVGDLDQFVATEEAQTSAVGEEVGDLLDIDFGL